MTRFLPRHVMHCFVILCFCLVTLPAHPALAANITYPGDPLGSIVAEPNSFFPGASLSGNSVTVNNGGAAIGGSVFGGVADSGIDNVTNNHVFINGGNVNSSVYGGYTQGTGNTTGNSVTINDGVVSWSVYGGRATSGSNVTGNSVTINGGTVLQHVFGGYASGAGNATDNTVTINGGTVSGVIAGGESITGDAFSGNTLNLKTSNLTVGWLYNFEFLNFYLPTTLAAGGTMLTVTNTADLTDDGVQGGPGRSSIVNVGINGASSPLKQGDSVTLIQAGTLITNDGLNKTANGSGMQGVTLKYEFGIAAANNQLTATVTSAPQVNEQTKALSEGFVSGAALVTQTGDLAAGKGMESAVDAAGGKTHGAGKHKQTSKAGAGAGTGLGTFGAITGGQLRYNSGSHVDMASLSLIAGLSFGADLPPGRLTLGAFFEYGNGSYNTYNSFSNAANVDGKGNLYHLGGGILGRMDFMDTGPGNFYAEASFRAGGVTNKYGSSDLRDALGRRAEYDSYSAYYGFHAGLGYIWNITEQASLDLYGKYFWTRQQGDSVRLSTGDPVKFKDVDSSRLRFGGRFAYAVNEHISPYIGAAWEHEFDGKARATTNGFDMGAPSLRGDTGIGELGLTLKPAKNLPLSFDLGVQGYVGKREGVTGSLQVRYEF